MKIEPLSFFAPVRGRFISGDMDKLRTRDHQNKPLDPEKQSYDFGIAFPKAEIWSLMAEKFYPYLAQAFASDAQAMQRLQMWFQQPGLPGAQGGLSMKIGDGDKPSATTGKVNEHAKGCFVFYATSFGMGATAEPPKAVAGPSHDKLVQIDISQIKRGDYVTFHGSINPNGLQGNNCGVYLNCDTVWKLADGDPIAGGIDPTQAFAGAALTGSFDPSGGAAAGFGTPAFTPSAPAPGPMAPAGLPGAAPALPGAAPGGTASHGEPHTQILNGPTPGMTPPLPGQG